MPICNLISSFPTHSQNSAKKKQTAADKPISTIIFDAHVDNLPTLLAGAAAGVNTYVLSPEQDGIAQITTILQQAPTASLTLVAHGFSGGINLGSSTLELNNLAQYASQLQTWFNLADSPQLTLMACNVAVGDAGAEFVAKLQTISKAKVIASNRPIGDSYWPPEATQLFASATLQNYRHILADGFTGEYYNDRKFRELALTRVDPSIDFDWEDKSPDESIEPDRFSVRWTGKIEPKFSETYTFITESDDGVRLWVDGQLIIDQFNNQPFTQHEEDIELQAGTQYDIRLEYFENRGDAIVRLLWSSASQPEELVTAAPEAVEEAPVEPPPAEEEPLVEEEPAAEEPTAETPIDIPENPGESPESPISENLDSLLSAETGANVLEVSRLGNAQVFSLTVEISKILTVGSLKIFSADANGNNRSQIGAFSIVENENNVLKDFAPTFNLLRTALIDVTHLQFELEEKGQTSIGTLTAQGDGTFSVVFEDGTQLATALKDTVPSPNVLQNDAATIDLTEQTGAVSISGEIRREASMDNVVDLYVTDADGAVFDAMGNRLMPGDAGYQAAAIASRLNLNLTGTQGKVKEFDATLTGGMHLGIFVVIDGVDPAVADTNQILFSHSGENNNVDHIKALGDNTFGVEDQAGLGDTDFNDIVISFNVV